jgi:hypothetical protein
VESIGESTCGEAKIPPDNCGARRRNRIRRRPRSAWRPRIAAALCEHTATQHASRRGCGIYAISIKPCAGHAATLDWPAWRHAPNAWQMKTAPWWRWISRLAAQDAIPVDAASLRPRRLDEESLTWTARPVLRCYRRFIAPGFSDVMSRKGSRVKSARSPPAVPLAPRMAGAYPVTESSPSGVVLPVRWARNCSAVMRPRYAYFPRDPAREIQAEKTRRDAPFTQVLQEP